MNTIVEALNAIQALREWVKAVPQDTPLPAMPGVDGDWLDAVEAALARGPAVQQEPTYYRERLKDWTCRKVENAGGTPGHTLYYTKLGARPELQLYIDEVLALWTNIGMAVGDFKSAPQPAAQEPKPGGVVTEADVQKILDNEREKLEQFHARFGKGTAQPAAQEPAQPDRHAELKSWSLLAARALDDCHRVIETIVAESSTEEEKLNELDKRVYDLFNQALCLHGLMTRTQLDKLTGFGRVEVTGPIDKPAVQEPATQFDDPRVQAVYEILADTDNFPPKDSQEHWEGWQARRIIDKLVVMSIPRLPEQDTSNDPPCFIGGLYPSEQLPDVCKVNTPAPPIGFTWIDFHRELQGAQWAAVTPGWTQALEMVCKRLLEIDAACRPSN